MKLHSIINSVICFIFIDGLILLAIILLLLELEIFVLYSDSDPGIREIINTPIRGIRSSV